MTTWKIDPLHSQVSFSVRHMVISKVRGKFGKWDAALNFNEANPLASTVEAQIDLASIDTGVADRDNHLRSSDFFDIATFPTMKFVSRSIAGTASEFVVTGDLTIRGVTQSVDLKVEAGGTTTDPWGNYRAGFSARATIDRKDFGVSWNQVLDAGGVAVGDKVEIDIEIEAIRG